MPQFDTSQFELVTSFVSIIATVIAVVVVGTFIMMAKKKDEK